MGRIIEKISRRIIENIITLIITTATIKIIIATATIIIRIIKLSIKIIITIRRETIINLIIK